MVEFGVIVVKFQDRGCKGITIQSTLYLVRARVLSHLLTVAASDPAVQCHHAKEDPKLCQECPRAARYVHVDKQPSLFQAPGLKMVTD